MRFNIATQPYLFVILLLTLCPVENTWAKQEDRLTAENSDPRLLKWMVGSPPPEDKLIMQPQSNYFSFPKLRWSVCHIRELLPTKQVSRGLDTPKPFKYQLDTGIDTIQFRTTNENKEMSWRESLSANYTDGILILHRDKVVYEEYLGCLNELGKHAAMSMTKSITGLLAEILIAEGKLDDTELVSSVVPELTESAFGSATIRQVMDMTTALDYSEDYSNPDADIWKYSLAASPLPKTPGYLGPDGYYQYLQTVKKSGAHGHVFGYKTINTDALGWIISRISQRSISDLLSEKIWRRIGAEQDAYMTVDGRGVPFAGGGLSASLRDLARLGLLMLNKGMINGERIFSESVVEQIIKGGDKTAFDKAGYSSLRGGSYRSMWWIFHNKHNAYAARGVHGQTIYIDPTAEMVIVRLASHPKAKNANIDPTSLPAFHAVADYLLKKESQ